MCYDKKNNQNYNCAGFYKVIYSRNASPVALPIISLPTKTSPKEQFDRYHNPLLSHSGRTSAWLAEKNHTECRAYQRIFD
jgi:hypothetical protein